MQGRGWRIARIWGVDVRVDPSLAIIAILLVSYLWSLFLEPGRFPGLGTAAGTGFAVLTTGLFLASILGHELAHAAMSKARGIPVMGITLYMFGGATYARVEDERPIDEFLTTVVGPATSATIGALFLLLHSAGRSWLPGPFDLMFEYLGRTNLWLAAFNLLPGFPLDGGRLLRSALWQATGSLATATSIAARVGQAFGAGMIAVGVGLGLSRQEFSWLWLGLIGWMLFQAATGALADGKRRRLLERATAGQVMSPPPPAVPADMPISEALTLFLIGHEGEAFPVMEGGAVVGFVSLATVAAAGVSPDRPAREAMAGPGATVVAGPDESMDSVAGRLNDHQGSIVLVVGDGQLVGVIEPADLDRFFRRARAS